MTAPEQPTPLDAFNAAQGSLPNLADREGFTNFVIGWLASVLRERPVTRGDWDEALLMARTDRTARDQFREYRVTFGQQYPREPHPTEPDIAHRDGWVAILAPSEEAARDLAYLRLGSAWSTIAPASDLYEAQWLGWYPLGERARWDTRRAEDRRRSDG